MEMTKRKETHWEPDIRRALDDLDRMKDLKDRLKEDADRRKIGGYNPGDTGQK
jgi:hypothetical protein